MSSRGLLRQGDVLLIPVDRLPEEASPRSSGDRAVLAEGEATGHAHAITADRARVFEHAFVVRWVGRRTTPYLVVEGDEPVVLTHEEHDPLAVPPGVYEVRRQREYEPGARRDMWVAD